MTVERKLVWTTIAGAVITAIVGGIGYLGVTRSTAAMKTMLASEVAAADHAARARASVLALRRLDKDIVLNVEDPARVADVERRWQEARAWLEHRLTVVATIVTAESDRRRLEAMRRDLDDYARGMAVVVAGIRTGAIRTPADGNRALARHDDAMHRLERHADDWAAEAHAGMQRATAAADGMARGSLQVVGAVTVIAACLAMAGGIAIACRPRRPNEPAAPRFEAVVALDRADEFGRMATALTRSVEAMRSALHEVQSVAEAAVPPPRADGRPSRLQTVVARFRLAHHRGARNAANAGRMRALR